MIYLFAGFTILTPQEGDGGIGVPSDDGKPDDIPEAEGIFSVAWSPDGSKIAYGISPSRCNLSNNNYYISIISTATGFESLRIDLRDRCPIIELQWSSDSSKLLSSTWQEANVWQVSDGQLLGYLRSSADYADFSDHDWSPDGSKIASVSASDPLVRIWEPYNESTGVEITSFVADGSTSVSWSLDSTKLALGSSTIEIWDLSGNQMPPTFTTAAGNIAWSPDGTKLAADFGYLYEVAIFDALTGKLMFTLEGHTALINEIIWRPDSQAAASASDDGTVRIWNIVTGTEIANFPYPGRVLTVDWNPSGDYIVFGGMSSDGKDTTIEIRSVGLTENPDEYYLPRSGNLHARRADHIRNHAGWSGSGSGDHWNAASLRRGSADAAECVAQSVGL
jgi:WD40 repeat protein